MKNIFVLVALFMGAFAILGGLNAQTSSADTLPFIFETAEKVATVSPTNKIVIPDKPEDVKAVVQVQDTVAAVAAAEPVQKVEQPKPVAPEKSNNPKHPNWLYIANAKVNARIVDVGVTETNNLDVPPNYVDVGWYKYGTLPGDVGSAVLDGHVDNGGNVDGVFKHLRDLKPGDEIFVTADDGSQTKFIVQSLDVYATKKFPSNVVFNDKTGKLLKIITCHGTFVPEIDTYDKRLIVTAELAE